MGLAFLYSAENEETSKTERTRMTLLRLYQPLAWDVSPIDHFNRMNAEIDRLLGGSSCPSSQAQQVPAWSPRLEVREDKDNVLILLDLPGVAKETLEITLHEGVLTVSGERKPEPASGEYQSHYVERPFGRFQRNLALPVRVRKEDTKAAFKDGVLTVTLPKADEAKPRQINVVTA